MGKSPVLGLSVLYSVLCLVQLLAVTLQVYLTPMSVVVLVFRGTVLCKGVDLSSGKSGVGVQVPEGWEMDGSKLWVDGQKGGQRVLRWTPWSHHPAQASQRSLVSLESQEASKQNL